MSAAVVRQFPERCFWGLLLFSTVYESYRYPLKLSFTGTSPTYSNTPLSIQMGKFIVTLVICLLVLPYAVKRRLSFRKWSLVVVVACLSGYLIFKGIAAVSGDRSPYMVAAFWPIAALVIVLSVKSITITGLDRYLRFLLVYALGSDALQVILFITTGRLPALGYPDSFSVRFGGFLDDPNAFSVLLYMLMGWVYFRFADCRRVLLEAALVVCVLLTQSLTGIGFLALLGLLFVAYHLIRRPKPLLFAGIAIVGGIVLALFWSPLVDLISGVLATKTGSVDSHLAQVGAHEANLGLWWLLGAPSLQLYESWWTGAPVNFGYPWYFLCLGVVGALVFSGFRAFRRARDMQYKAVVAGIFLLSCYFVIGCINLPFFEIFPSNFLFFFFSSLIFFEKIEVKKVPSEQKQLSREMGSTNTFRDLSSLRSLEEQ